MVLASDKNISNRNDTKTTATTTESRKKQPRQEALTCYIDYMIHIYCHVTVIISVHIFTYCWDDSIVYTKNNNNNTSVNTVQTTLTTNSSSSSNKKRGKQRMMQLDILH
jgi:hypothetical protein